MLCCLFFFYKQLKNYALYRIRFSFVFLFNAVATDGLALITDNILKQIDHVDLNTLTKVTFVDTELGFPFRGAYNPDEQMVYWSDIGQRKIKRAPLSDGTAIETLVTLPSGQSGII